MLPVQLSKRGVIALLASLIVLITGVAPTPIAHAAGTARWIPTPSIWDFLADNNAQAWTTTMSADCQDITFTIGSALEEFPQEQINGFPPYAYRTVTWYLVNVFDQTRTPIPLADGPGPHLIAEYTAEESEGLSPSDPESARIIKERTFAFAEPVEAGKRMFASLRVDYTYYEIPDPTQTQKTATFATFDLGNFDDPFDYLRADGLPTPFAGSYFCNTGHARSAPTVRLAGHGIAPEGDSGQQGAPFYLVLSAPTDKPVDVEFYVNYYNRFEDHWADTPVLTKPVCSGRSGSSTYVCPRPPEGPDTVESYTIVTIPPGQTVAPVWVEFFGNTAQEYYLTYSAGIGAAANAHIAANTEMDPNARTATFVRVDDDGCPDPNPLADCIVEMGVPGYPSPYAVYIPKSIEFYVTSDAPSVGGVPTFTEGGPANFTVYLSHDRDRTGDDNVTVDYTVVGVTATEGVDFAPASGTLTFAPGQTSQVFPLTLLQDDKAEPLEYFKVVLSNPSGNANIPITPFEFIYFIADDELTYELLANGGFELAGATANNAASWRGKVGTQTRRRCNVTNRANGKPDTLVAWGGDCAYQLIGANKVVNQPLKDSLVGDLLPQVGDFLTFSARIQTVNLTKGALISATIFFTDQTKRVISFNGKPGTNAYTLRSKRTAITKPVSRIAVRVATGPAKGTLRVDDLSLLLTRPTTGALSNPLALPGAPDALRGSN
jgi:hypothetical protein